MKLVMVCVRDSKSEVFGTPFFLATVGAAIRSFDDEVNRSAEDNMMFQHSADFALFQLGTYDNSSGTFETIVPKLLVLGDEVRKWAKVSKV